MKQLTLSELFKNTKCSTVELDNAPVPDNVTSTTSTSLISTSTSVSTVKHVGFTKIEWPNDISKCSDDGPQVPLLANYPKSKFDSERSFCYHWKARFSWIEYSVLQDATFCHVCRHHANQSSRFYLESCFIRNGMKNWKKALEKFREHDQSKLHLNALIAKTAYENAKTSVV